MFPATWMRYTEIPDQLCRRQTTPEAAPQNCWNPSVISAPKHSGQLVRFLPIRSTRPVKHKTNKNFMVSTLDTSCRQEYPFAGAALEQLSLIPIGNIFIQVSFLLLKRKEVNQMLERAEMAGLSIGNLHAVPINFRHRDTCESIQRLLDG